MNAARQISRRFGRATVARTRSAANYSMATGMVEYEEGGRMSIMATATYQHKSVHGVRPHGQPMEAKI